ncbi:dehydrogenase/reductase SDR family member 7B isoform X3 [Balaenoptera acutorostrata]|uniref:Dehydrogenase/reductase SDR family member 7B n=1 Tax=Balaenoptera acutorostrata TaxID=9767 RepID=A0A383ZHA5_BALAC|nr:dehydrogenase/reductase SDR family member 7B isoform X3 [Balaenoptera acutorostrata]
MDPLNLVPYLPRAEWSLGPGDQGWLAMLGQVLKEYQTCTRRRSLLRARVMDFVTSTAILPLLLGCVGVCSLLKLLQWLRTRACVRNAVVVVTGATSGLGRECARVFHAAGAKLVLCGRNAKALEELTRELAASRATKVQTHKPYTVTFDLTDPGAIVGAAAEILQCFGYVDVLINNAGISYRGTIVDTSLDVDRRVMETNYFGPVALTKALLSSMIRRRQGHVVAISSIQGKISVPFRSALMDETTAQGRSPSQVARDVLAAVGKKKKDVVLADVVPSLAVYLRTLAPRLFFSLMASRARKEQKPKRC